jgi:biotin operon repressor
MRNTLYEFHLLKDGLYSKQYFREKTTQELKQKIEELRKQGYEILSVEVS